MNIDKVFDSLFKRYPKAKEGKTLGYRPHTPMSWSKVDDKTYTASGPRGGKRRIRYCEKSNKITIGYENSDVD